MKTYSLEARIAACELILKHLDLKNVKAAIQNDLNAVPYEIRGETKDAVRELTESVDEDRVELSIIYTGDLVTWGEVEEVVTKTYMEYLDHWHNHHPAPNSDHAENEIIQNLAEDKEKVPPFGKPSRFDEVIKKLESLDKDDDDEETSKTVGSRKSKLPTS